jgi:hypothetical protein
LLAKEPAVAKSALPPVALRFDVGLRTFAASARRMPQQGASGHSETEMADDPCCALDQGLQCADIPNERFRGDFDINALVLAMRLADATEDSGLFGVRF